ncbi:hypothetical protein PoB_004982400 [Plakobranchus ocellatus]|uniref:Uncharacterized protein n=1 Tax=Plakobranchus ocellatus TaxID=259542 RepID=A0AAV4BWY0_9GAST|nr:hypothetical protein PoB_004982400 [Plakobranchus ocellatus]
MLFHAGRLAEKSQSSHPYSKLFLSVSMLPALSHQDFVPPSGVNICALAFGWSGRPLRHILLSQVLVTLVYISWLRATERKLGTCFVVCLPWYSEHVGSSFIPHRTRFLFFIYSSDEEVVF